MLVAVDWELASHRSTLTGWVIAHGVFGEPLVAAGITHPRLVVPVGHAIAG